jgi:Ca2+:H+ antiporter
MTTILREQRALLLGSKLNLLLVCLPLAILLHAQHATPVAVFAVAALAVVPLAGLIGAATEATTEHTGPSLGGLLNATFGNATELLIAFFAVREGLYGVVKASIIGSILGNMLLVLGAAMLVGGLRHGTQTFSRTHASASASMLVVAFFALSVPVLYEIADHIPYGQPNAAVDRLSWCTAIVLIVLYVLGTVFSLRTNTDVVEHDRDGSHHAGPHTSLAGATVALVLATILTAVAAEILVDALHPAAQALGWTEVFVGAIVVAVVGNAAEHSTAIVVAAKNDMRLAYSIAIGSSTQIALLVAPLLVLASFVVGPHPMDLVFAPAAFAVTGLSIWIVKSTSSDGESNWFEGAMLMGAYALVALLFYFLPEAVPAAEATATSRH